MKQAVLMVAMTVVGSGVIVSVAVDDMSVEAVLIGDVFDGPHVAAGFLQGVFSYNLVSIAGLLLSVVVSSLVVSHSVSVVVLRVSLQSNSIFSSCGMEINIDKSQVMRVSRSDESLQFKINTVACYRCEVWFFKEQRKLLALEIDYLRRSARVSRLQKSQTPPLGAICKQKSQF